MLRVLPVAPGGATIQAAAACCFLRRVLTDTLPRVFALAKQASRVRTTARDARACCRRSLSLRVAFWMRMGSCVVAGVDVHSSLATATPKVSGCSSRSVPRSRCGHHATE